MHDDRLTMSYALAAWLAGRDEVVAIEAKRELQRVFPRQRGQFTLDLIDRLLGDLAFDQDGRHLGDVAASAIYRRRGTQRSLPA